MSDRTYPYAAWTLMPSFKPVMVNIVEKYLSYSSGNNWELSSRGRAYSLSELFPTKEATIAAGWERIHVQEAKLAKMQASIDKKRIALAKAAEA